MNCQHFLYRLRGANGALLYVGITTNVERRGHEHRAEKLWYSEVASVDEEAYPDRASAHAAEVVAIRTEAPKYNSAHAVKGASTQDPGRFAGWSREHVLAELTHAAEKIVQADRARDTLIREGAGLDIPKPQLAAAAKLSRRAVYDILEKQL